MKVIIIAPFAFVVAALVYAQDFVLQSRLTTYENTLLDATNFILFPEETGSNIPSYTTTAFNEPSSTFAPPPLSAKTASLINTGKSVPVSIVTSTVPSPSRVPTILTSGSTLEILTLEGSEEPNRAEPTCSGAHNGATTAKFSVATSDTTHRAWLDFTRPIYVNTTRNTSMMIVATAKSQDKSTVRRVETVTDLFTYATIACESGTEEGSSLSVLYPTLLPSQVSVSATPTSASLSPASHTPSPTPLPTLATIGCEQITTTVYSIPSIWNYFASQVDGTEILVLEFSQPTCNPVWPFHENLQWDVLSTIPFKTQLAPTLQKIPANQVVGSIESALNRRDEPCTDLAFTGSSGTAALVTAFQATSTVHLLESAVLTTTCLSAITSYPDISASFLITTVAGASLGPTSTVPATGPASDLASSLTSAISSFGAVNGITSGSLQITPDNSADSVVVPLFATTGPVVSTVLITTMVNATVTQTQAVTVSAITTRFSTVTVGPNATDIGSTVESGIDTAAFSSGKCRSSTQFTSAGSDGSNKATIIPARTLLTGSNSYGPVGSSGFDGLSPSVGLSTSYTVQETSTVMPSYPCTDLTSEVVTVAETETLAASTGRTSSGFSSISSATEVLVTPDSSVAFGPVASTNSVSTHSASTYTSRDSNGATYACAPWSRGNDVLVCHLNGQTKLSVPINKWVILGSVALIASLNLSI